MGRWVLEKKNVRLHKFKNFKIHLLSSRLTIIEVPPDCMEPRLMAVSTSTQLCEVGYLVTYFKVLLLGFPKLHSISFEKPSTGKVAC